MAYRKASRNSLRRTTRSRVRRVSSYSKGTRRRNASRGTTTRRRKTTRRKSTPRTLRIEVIQTAEQSVNPLAAAGLKEAPAPRKARF